MATTRFRRVGAVTASIYSLYFWNDIHTARLCMLLSVFVGLLGLELADKFVMHRLPWSKRWLMNFLITFLLQTTFILATGGIRSPFVMVYVPITIVVALALQWRGLIPMLIGELTVIATLTTLELSNKIPHWFYPDRLTLPKDPELTVVWGLLASALLTSLGVIGLKVTQTLREHDLRTLAAQQVAAEALRVRNQDLVSLTGAVAHELKNPLTAAQNLATLMHRRATTGTKDEEMLDVMVTQLHRVRDSLQEFLDFSRPLNSLQLQQVDLQALAHQLVEVHQGIASEHNVVLRLQDEDAVIISGDSRKLQQVMMNLIQNAIEASPDGERVDLSCRSVPEGAVFEVRDRGQGLDPALQARLFRPGATTKETGTGLGLTISLGLTEQHGGDLTLTNAPDGGCVATVTLPATPPLQETA